MELSVLKKKHYFITYQATNRSGDVSIWNEVINVSPMEFILIVAKYERESSQTYQNFIVINTCKISETDYNTYKNNF